MHVIVYFIKTGRFTFTRPDRYTLSLFVLFGAVFLVARCFVSVGDPLFNISNSLKQMILINWKKTVITLSFIEEINYVFVLCLLTSMNKLI